MQLKRKLHSYLHEVEALCATAVFRTTLQFIKVSAPLWGNYFVIVQLRKK